MYRSVHYNHVNVAEERAYTVDEHWGIRKQLKLVKYANKCATPLKYDRK